MVRREEGGVKGGGLARRGEGEGVLSLCMAEVV